MPATPAQPGPHAPRPIPPHGPPQPGAAYRRPQQAFQAPGSWASPPVLPAQLAPGSGHSAQPPIVAWALAQQHTAQAEQEAAEQRAIHRPWQVTTYGFIMAIGAPIAVLCLIIYLVRIMGTPGASEGVFVAGAVAIVVGLGNALGAISFLQGARGAYLWFLVVGCLNFPLMFVISAFLVVAGLWDDSSFLFPGILGLGLSVGGMYMIANRTTTWWFNKWAVEVRDNRRR